MGAKHSHTEGISGSGGQAGHGSAAWLVGPRVLSVRVTLPCHGRADSQQLGEPRIPLRSRSVSRSRLLVQVTETLVEMPLPEPNPQNQHLQRCGLRIHVFLPFPWTPNTLSITSPRVSRHPQWIVRCPRLRSFPSRPHQCTRALWRPARGRDNQSPRTAAVVHA